MIDQLVEKIKKTIAELVYDKVKLRKAYNYYHCWIRPYAFLYSGMDFKRCHFKIWRDHGGGRRSDLGI